MYCKIIRFLQDRCRSSQRISFKLSTALLELRIRAKIFIGLQQSGLRYKQSKYRMHTSMPNLDHDMPRLSSRHGARRPLPRVVANVWQVSDMYVHKARTSQAGHDLRRQYAHQVHVSIHALTVHDRKKKSGRFRRGTTQSDCRSQLCDRPQAKKLNYKRPCPCHFTIKATM